MVEPLPEFTVPFTDMERMIAVLFAASSGFVSRELVYDELFKQRSIRPNKLTVRQYIFRIRQKLRPYGILIETDREAGWRISDEHLVKLRALRKQDPTNAPRAA